MHQPNIFLMFYKFNNFFFRMGELGQGIIEWNADGKVLSGDQRRFNILIKTFFKRIVDSTKRTDI